jgi:hypothetical protein
MKFTINQLRKIISEEMDPDAAEDAALKRHMAGIMARHNDGSGRKGAVKKLPKKAGKRIFSKQDNAVLADGWWQQLTEKFPNLTSKVTFDDVFEFWDTSMVHAYSPHDQFEEDFIRYLEKAL